MTSLFAKALTAGGALLVSTISSAAFAADLGPYQPYNPPQTEVRYESPAIWEGAYVGINGGYGWSNSNFTKPEGGFGGGQIGYNWQRGPVVFGFEGDIQGSDITGDAFNTATLDVAHSNVNWFSTVRGRLGFASGPWLFYGTGGVAFADVDNHIHFAGGGGDRNSGIDTGYAAGGGIEWAFAPNWSAKAEYLYVGLGDDEVGGYRINNDFQTFRVGLNYKFH